MKNSISALRRYNEQYNNDVYCFATELLDTDQAIRLQDAAMAICGGNGSGMKLLRPWGPCARAFLALFVVVPTTYPVWFCRVCDTQRAHNELAGGRNGIIYECQRCGRRWERGVSANG